MIFIKNKVLNGLDLYAYLSYVLKRLPTHKVPQISDTNRRITATPVATRPKLKIGMGFSARLPKKAMNFMPLLPFIYIKNLGVMNVAIEMLHIPMNLLRNL